jgi:hypothetical protein
MLDKVAVVIATVVLVHLGFGLTDAVAGTGLGGFDGRNFDRVRADGGGEAWREGAWDGGAWGGVWRGAGWHERGWSWDSNWGWGWPAPAAAWYYGPYYGACLQPKWTGNGWKWVNVC